jgi:hypothetical protein
MYLEGLVFIENPDYLQKFLDTLVSPNLQYLEELEILMGEWDGKSAEFTLQCGKAIIDTIIGNLHCLKVIILGMPIDLAWCSAFSQLSQLESLKWGVAGVYEDSEMIWSGDNIEMTPLEGRRGNLRLCLRSLLRSLLLHYFEGPRLEVSVTWIDSEFRSLPSSDHLNIQHNLISQF